MKRSLRNTSRLEPLTPSIPEPSCKASLQHPTVAPDVRAESVLFALYLEQKALAQSWQSKFEHMQRKLARVEDRWTKFRTRNRLRKLASDMTGVPLLPKREESK
jgi:hypothetical protein